MFYANGHVDMSKRDVQESEVNTQDWYHEPDYYGGTPSSEFATVSYGRGDTVLIRERDFNRYYPPAVRPNIQYVRPHYTVMSQGNGCHFPAPRFPPPYYPEYRSFRPTMQNYPQPHRSLVPGPCRTWQEPPHRSNPHRRHHLDDIYYANYEDEVYGSRSEEKNSRYTRTPVRIDIKRQNTVHKIDNTSKEKCANGPKCDDKLKDKHEIKTVTKTNKKYKETGPDLSKPKPTDNSRINDKTTFKSDKKEESNKTHDKAIIMEGNTGRKPPLKRRSSYQGEPKTKHRRISSAELKHEIDKTGKQETERKDKRLNDNAPRAHSNVSGAISHSQNPSSDIEPPSATKQKSDSTTKNSKNSNLDNEDNHENPDVEKPKCTIHEDSSNQEVEEYDIVKELEITINSLSKTSAHSDTDLVQEGSATPDITSSSRPEFKKDIKMKLIHSSPSSNDSSTLNKIAANDSKKKCTLNENTTLKKTKNNVKNKFPLYVDEQNNKNPEKPVLEEIFILEDALKDMDSETTENKQPESSVTESTDVQVVEPDHTIIEIDDDSEEPEVAKIVQADDNSTKTIKVESSEGGDGSGSSSPTNIEVAKALGLTQNIEGFLNLDTRMTYLYSFNKYFDDHRTVDMDISQTPSPSKTFDNTTLSAEQFEIDVNVECSSSEATLEFVKESSVEKMKHLEVSAKTTQEVQDVKDCSSVVKENVSASNAIGINEQSADYKISTASVLPSKENLVATPTENTVNINTQLLQIFGDEGTSENENKCEEIICSSRSRYRSKSFCSLIPGKTATKSLRKIKSLSDISGIRTDRSFAFTPSNLMDYKEELISLLSSGCDDNQIRESTQKVSHVRGSQQSEVDTATKSSTRINKKRTRSFDNYEDESSTPRKPKKLPKSNKSDKPKREPLKADDKSHHTKPNVEAIKHTSKENYITKGEYVKTCGRIKSPVDIALPIEITPLPHTKQNVEAIKHTSKDKYITKGEYVKTFGRIKSPVDIALSIETTPLPSAIKRRRATFTCEADNETILKKVDKQRTRQTFLELFGPSSGDDDDEEEESVKLKQQQEKKKSHSNGNNSKEPTKSKPKPEVCRKISRSGKPEHNSVDKKSTEKSKERRDNKPKEKDSKERRQRRSRSKSKENHADRRRSSSKSRRQSTSSNDSSNSKHNYKRQKSKESSANKNNAPEERHVRRSSAHQESEKNVIKTTKECGLKQKENSAISKGTENASTKSCTVKITKLNKKTSGEAGNMNRSCSEASLESCLPINRSSKESSTNRKSNVTMNNAPEYRHARRASKHQESEKNAIETTAKESVLKQNEKCDVNIALSKDTKNASANKIEMNRQMSGEPDNINRSCSEKSLIIDESCLPSNESSTNKRNKTKATIMNNAPEERRVRRASAHQESEKTFVKTEDKLVTTKESVLNQKVKPAEKAPINICTEKLTETNSRTPGESDNMNSSCLGTSLIIEESCLLVSNKKNKIKATMNSTPKERHVRRASAHREPEKTVIKTEDTTKEEEEEEESVKLKNGDQVNKQQEKKKERVLKQKENCDVNTALPKHTENAPTNNCAKKIIETNRRTSVEPDNMNSNCTAPSSIIDKKNKIKATMNNAHEERHVRTASAYQEPEKTVIKTEDTTKEEEEEEEESVKLKNGDQVNKQQEKKKDRVLKQKENCDVNTALPKHIENAPTNNCAKKIIETNRRTSVEPDNMNSNCTAPSSIIDKKNKIKATMNNGLEERHVRRASAHQEPEKTVIKTEDTTKEEEEESVKLKNGDQVNKQQEKKKERVLKQKENCDVNTALSKHTENAPTNNCAKKIIETNRRTSVEPDNMKSNCTEPSSIISKKNKIKATMNNPLEECHVRRASAHQEPEKTVINTEDTTKESVLKQKEHNAPINMCAEKITETNRRMSAESDIMNSSCSETSLIIDESCLLMNRASESDVNISIESCRPYLVTSPQFKRLTSFETVQDECTDKVYISDSPDIRENDCITVQQTRVKEDNDVVEVTPPVPTVDLTREDNPGNRRQETLTDLLLETKKEIDDVVGVEGTITLYRAEEGSSDQADVEAVSASVSVGPASGEAAVLKEESERIEKTKTSQNVLAQSQQPEKDANISPDSASKSSETSTDSAPHKDATRVVDLSRPIPNQSQNTLDPNASLAAEVNSVPVNNRRNYSYRLPTTQNPSNIVANQEGLISRLLKCVTSIGNAPPIDNSVPTAHHGQQRLAPVSQPYTLQSCQPPNLVHQPNTSSANEETVVDLTNDNQELSSIDQKIIVEIFTRHVYFLAHLCNAQKAYVESLSQRPFYNYYFKAEIALFEHEKSARLLRQSTRLCSELQYLGIRANRNLGDMASVIVEHVTVNLKNKDMPKSVTKSIVYLLIGELMRPQAELFSSIPLFKTLIRHCNIVASKMQKRSGGPFTEEMRRTLAFQIQEYTRLFGQSPLHPNQIPMMNTSRLNTGAAPPQFNPSTNARSPPAYNSTNHILTERRFNTNIPRGTNENPPSVLKQLIVRPHSTTVTTSSTTNSDPSYLLSRNNVTSESVQGPFGQASMNPPRSNMMTIRPQKPLQPNKQSSSGIFRPPNQHVFARPKIPNSVRQPSNNQVTDIPGGPNTNTLGRTPRYLPSYDTPAHNQVYASPGIQRPPNANLFHSYWNSQMRQVPQAPTFSIPYDAFATRTTPSSVQTDSILCNMPDCEGTNSSNTPSQLQSTYGDSRKQSENLLEELLTPGVNQALFAQSKSPVNDNFRIKLPFTKPVTPPITTVTTTVAGPSISSNCHQKDEGATRISTVSLETENISLDSQPIIETEDQQVLVNNSAINNKYVVGEAPTSKVLNQGLHALSSIGQPSAMLNSSSGSSITKKPVLSSSPRSTNKSKQAKNGKLKANKAKTEPKKRGRTPKASKRKKQVKGSEDVETVEIASDEDANTEPDKSQKDMEKVVVQQKETTDNTPPDLRNKTPTPPTPQEALESTGSKEASTEAEAEDMETIDLTWIDDMDEEELQSEMDFVFVKQENVENETADESNSRVVPSPVDSGIASPPIQGEEDTIYTVVRSLCICGKIAQYNCACGDAWYCGQQCQMVDWEWHQKICPTVQETT